MRCPPPVLVPLHPINRQRYVYFETCARAGPIRPAASFAFFGQFRTHFSPLVGSLKKRAAHTHNIFKGDTNRTCGVPTDLDG